MLNRLLQNLPGFFDRDPEPVLAMRVESPLGFHGQIAQNILSWREGDQGAVHAVDLRAFTLAELAQHLTAAGLTVTALNADYSDSPACRLIPSDIPGLSNRSYRDGFYVSTSILWAHLQALAQELSQAETALAAMLRQLILPNAREGWADYWGYRLGMARHAGESDSAYTQRMIDELYRARNNPVAMRTNVQRLTGADIELFEPWTRMWTLSRSTLSGGDDHFPSGDYYAYHCLHPRARRPGVDWTRVLPVLQADRPAGTLLIDPSEQWDPVLIDGDALGDSLSMGRDDQSAHRISLLNCKLLSENLYLSAHCVVRNHPFLIWTQTTSSAVAGADPLPDWTWRTVCKGEIALSDAPPLGDFQARLPGMQWIEIGAPDPLSGPVALSDGLWRRERQPVDEWMEQGHAAAADLSAVQGALASSGAALRSVALDAPQTPEITTAGRDAEHSILLFAYPPATWIGIWGPQPWIGVQPGPWPSLSYTSESNPGTINFNSGYQQSGDISFG